MWLSHYKSIKWLFPCQSTKWCHLRRLCLASVMFFVKTVSPAPYFLSWQTLLSRAWSWSFDSCSGEMQQKLLWCCKELTSIQLWDKTQVSKWFSHFKEGEMSVDAQQVLAILQCTEWMKMWKGNVHNVLEDRWHTT